MVPSGLDLSGAGIPPVGTYSMIADKLKFMETQNLANAMFHKNGEELQEIFQM